MLKKRLSTINPKSSQNLKQVNNLINENCNLREINIKLQINLQDKTQSNNCLQSRILTLEMEKEFQNQCIQELERRIGKIREITFVMDR